MIEKYIDNGGSRHVLQSLSSHHKYDKGVANKADEEYDGKGDGNDVEGQDANHHLQKIVLVGHSCKIGNMRCPGTLKNQNPQFE